MFSVVYRHYLEFSAILVIFTLYKILKHYDIINMIKDHKYTCALLPLVRTTFVEFYYCSVLVLVVIFIYFQFPKVSMVTDLATIVQFLFTPPLKYLIILQISFSLIIGIFTLPSVTIERIITPFGHYSVTKRVEAVKQEMNRVVDVEVQKVKDIFRLRNSMLLETSLGSFSGLIVNGYLDEDKLYEFTSYLRGSFNIVFGENAVTVLAVPIYLGNLDLSRSHEIPTHRILDAYAKKQIVTSDEGVLPSEIAVPLEFAQNCSVILYMSNLTAQLEMEDGETIYNMWQIITANDTELVERGLQG